LSTFADSPPSGGFVGWREPKTSLRKSEVVVVWAMGDHSAPTARGKEEAQENFSAADRRKPLKRLNSDKAIQGNPSLSLAKARPRLIWVCVDLG
jgi:hypothetical protein